MMREVVIYAHSSRFAEKVLATAHAFEARKVRACFVHSGTEALGARRDCGDCVAHVVTAGDAQRESPASDPAGEEIEGLRAVLRERSRRPEPSRRHVARVVAIERKPRHARTSLVADEGPYPRIARVAYEESGRWHAAEKRAESPFVGRDVGVNAM